MRGNPRGEGPQPRPSCVVRGCGETGNAPPVADAASLFRGIRRSAASGRISESDSRQGPGWQTRSVWEPEWPNGEQMRHDWQTRSGRESHRHDGGQRNRNAPTFLVGMGGVFAPKTSPIKEPCHASGPTADNA